MATEEIKSTCYLPQGREPALKEGGAVLQLGPQKVLHTVDDFNTMWLFKNFLSLTALGDVQASNLSEGLILSTQASLPATVHRAQL